MPVLAPGCMNRKTKEEVLEEFRSGTIQDAALAVIARKGVDEATVQEIADEAGVAKGTVYVYFRDREELLAKTADRAFDRLIDALEPAFNSSGTFSERLTAVVVRQLEFFDENDSLFRATMALSQRNSESAQLCNGSRGLYIARLEKMFVEARDRGEIRDLDPIAVAALYRDCVRGVIIRRIEKQSRTPRIDEASFIVSILLHGIAATEVETEHEA
jgi:AcrR family transcriptional regulator